jgi:RimJ/RimL family protein N-acetyltransferase
MIVAVRRSFPLRHSRCWCTACVYANRTAGSARNPVLTPRLVLTPVGLDDVDDLVLLYGDPQVALWTGPWTRVAVKAWAASMAARWAEDGVGKWIARDRSGGSLVGRGGFTRVDLNGETVLELGWAVRDARTGRGYATELGQAALAWATEHRPGEPVVRSPKYTTVPRGRSWSGSECCRQAPSSARASCRAGLECSRTPPSPCIESELRRRTGRKPAPSDLAPQPRPPTNDPLAHSGVAARPACGARHNQQHGRRRDGPARACSGEGGHGDAARGAFAVAARRQAQRHRLGGGRSDDPAARGGSLHQHGAVGAPSHAAGTSGTARREASNAAPAPVERSAPRRGRCGRSPQRRACD